MNIYHKYKRWFEFFFFFFNSKVISIKILKSLIGGFDE